MANIGWWFQCKTPIMVQPLYQHCWSCPLWLRSTIQLRHHRSNISHILSNKRKKQTRHTRHNVLVQLCDYLTLHELTTSTNFLLTTTLSFYRRSVLRYHPPLLVQTASLTGKNITLFSLTIPSWPLDQPTTDSQSSLALTT